MQTVLTLHNDPALSTLLTRLGGPDLQLQELSLAHCHSEEQLLRVLPPHVQLADALLVDLPSLEILGKWILAWLKAHHSELPVVVRLSHHHLATTELHPDWRFFFDNDPLERARLTLHSYLAHLQLRREHELLKQRLARQNARVTPSAPATLPSEDGQPYREAFKNLSRLLGHTHDLHSLAEHVVSLVREMFGLGKIALFIREREPGLFQAEPLLPRGRCTLIASIGIPRDLVKHFSLSLETGIGRQAAAQARIVRRDGHGRDLLDADESRIRKEFEVLGTDFAVPVLDRDHTLGLLTFGGKVTGEPFRNEELELIFHLMNQLGMMIKSVWLHQEVIGQQSFMRDVLANVLNGVVVVNAKNRITTFNRRAAELLGVHQVGALGSDASWLPSQVADVLFEALHAGKTCQQREIFLQKTRRFLSVSTSLFVTAEDEVRGTGNVYAVGVIEDITDWKAQHAQARALEQQEFILQLASRLSHELKNSLVSISTFAQLLPQQYDRKEFRDEFFKIVAQEVTRVDLLVENLTFFAQPLRLKCEETDLGALLDAVISRVCEQVRRQTGAPVASGGSGQPTLPSATGQPIQINKRIGHTAKKIECDPRRLSLALHNLVYNSIQSMPQGGRVSLVTDDAKPNGHTEARVTISVIDTGEGIAIAHLEQIFQPFFTTRNVGVGLGLTIAQKIIQQHGGHIAVESKLGKGTTMTVTLPVRAQPPAETEPPPAQAPARTAVPDATPVAVRRTHQAPP